MDISDKEILIDELNEHIRQTKEATPANPFRELDWRVVRKLALDQGVHKKHEFYVMLIPMAELECLE